MTASIRVANTSNWDQSVLVEQVGANHMQHLARGQVSDPIGIPHDGKPVELHVKFGQEHDTKHPETGSPYLGEIAVRTIDAATEPSPSPDTFDSRHPDDHRTHIMVAVGTWSWALQMLKEGREVHRPSWNGKGMYVRRHAGGLSGLGSKPFYVIQHANGDLQPGWVPSIGDCEAEDWQVLGGTSGL